MFIQPIVLPTVCTKPDAGTTIAFQNGDLIANLWNLVAV